MDNQPIKFKLAVATSDGIVVNQHFGRAQSFRIYAVTQDSKITFLEERNFEPLCQSGSHDESQLEKRIAAITDCKYILVSRIGQGASEALQSQGIFPIEMPGFINESIEKLMKYNTKQNEHTQLA